MIKINIKGLDVHITTESFAKENGMQSTALVKQLELVWLWPNTRPWESILKATEHDPSKIDYAVPQPWLDEQYQKWGYGHWRTKAFWTYEVNGFYGAPLFQRDVINKFTRLLLEEVVCGLADGLIEMKEVESVKF